jgi:hypothetical protein
VKKPTYPERYINVQADLRPWESQKVQVTVIPRDEPVSTLTLNPEDVVPNQPPNVIGLGRFLGGQKHGVRRGMAPRATGEWRMALYEYYYEEGTVLVQRIEVRR